MKRYRVGVVVTVVVASFVLVSSAVAFDCIRVSSSLQGLQQSAGSGNWVVFDLSSVEGVQRTFATIEEPVPSAAQAQCLVSAYAASGQPRFFALGIGVAGPRGVLAWRNETAAIGDGRGIDQLEHSGVLPAFFAAGESCGIE